MAAFRLFKTTTPTGAVRMTGTDHSSLVGASAQTILADGLALASALRGLWKTER